MTARVLHLKYAKRALRLGFVQALGSKVTQVAWGMHPAIPRPARPFCRLTFASGMGAELTDHDEQRQAIALDSASLTIDTVTVGNTYRARLNGIPMDYTALGGDDPTDVRDGLLAAILAEGLGEFFTAAASGGDTIDVTPAAPGHLFSAVITPFSETSVVTDTSSDTQITLTVGRRVGIVRCDFFTDGERPIEDGAMDLAAIARASLGQPFSRELQQRYRVPLRALGSAFPLPDLEAGGAEVESRAMFEVHVAMSSCALEVITPIESTEITTVASGAANTFTVPPP